MNNTIEALMKNLFAYRRVEFEYEVDHIAARYGNKVYDYIKRTYPKVWDWMKGVN